MAVDQARNLNHFKEIIISPNNSTVVLNNPSNLYRNATNNSPVAGAVLPAMFNDTLLCPFYNLNDVVFHQQQLSGARKIAPAVKDDSGVTFNNSLVPPPSRKRPREASAAVLPPAPIATTACISSKESSNGFSFLGKDLSLQIMQQHLELDRLISQHIEKMSMEIGERKKHQTRIIMAAIQESMGKRLREKDEEIVKIGRINWALEERVKSLYLENQIWRDLAQTNEATANALRTNLEQVLYQVNKGGNVIDLTDDAVSCCGSSGYGDDGTGLELVDKEEKVGRRKIISDSEVHGNNGGEEGKKGWIYRGKNKRMCRKCGEGESSVLVLPCRHLCLCTICGPAVNACPICNSAKSASVHVNLS